MVYSLVGLFTDIVFPEQDKEYAIHLQINNLSYHQNADNLVSKHRLLRLVIVCWLKVSQFSKMKQVYYLHVIIIYTLYAARMSLHNRRARFLTTSALPRTSDTEKEVGTFLKVLATYMHMLT